MTVMVNPDGSIPSQPGEYAPGAFDQGMMEETRIVLIGLDDAQNVFTKTAVTVVHDLTDAEIVDVIAAVKAGAVPDIPFAYTISEGISPDFASPLSEAMSGRTATRLAFHLDVESWLFSADRIPFTLKDPDPDGQFWSLRTIDDAAGRSRTLSVQNLNSVVRTYYFNLHVDVAGSDGRVLPLTIDPAVRNDGDPENP